MNITEVIVPQQELAWLPWAVQYFFFVGLAATAALIAVIGEFVRGGRWQRLQPAAFVVAISTGIVAPVALLADLHQPGRFYHFYTDITVWSWMSLGALILPLFLIGLFGYYALWQRDQFRANGAPHWLRLWTRGDWSGAWLRRGLAGMTVIGAIGVLVYTGAEVMIVEARALWHTEWLIVNLAATALMGTTAAMLYAQSRLVDGSPGDQRLTLRLFLAALIVTGAGAAGWAVSGMLFQSVSFVEFSRLLGEFAYWQIVFGASVLVGLALLVGAVWMLRTPRGVAHGWWLAPFALLAVWSFRWAVLMDVQTVPKYGAGLYPYEMPLGSDGLLGILGIFGLWLAVMVVLPGVIAGVRNDTESMKINEVAHG